MDAVITYVNGSDPLWQADYAAFAGEPVLEKRYRDWGTLRYLLRGIETLMPFVDRVFLVVARPSQVPSWASPALIPVLHRDIIPAAFLPTFNSTTIELFLPRIPGLSEQFLYFNDDVFPLRPVSSEVFFPGGKPAKGYSRHLLAPNEFKRQCRNACQLARKAAGLGESALFLRPQHAVTPLLKSVCLQLMDAVKAEMEARLTPLRHPSNINQYLYSDYLLLTGQAVNRRIAQKHLSLGLYDAREVAAFLQRPTADFACINDVQMSQERFEESRRILLEAFEARFPAPSRFECQP